MDTFQILVSKTVHVRLLQRYVGFIQACKIKNSSSNEKFEKHHICPKAKDLFPEYKDLKLYPWNRVDLTFRQHFIAHMMLEKIFGGSQKRALWYMSKKGTMQVSSRLYERMKLDHENFFKEARKSAMTSEARKKAGKKISIANKGRKHTPLTRARMSVARTGKHHSKESKLKISQANRLRKGRKYGKKSLDRCFKCGALVPVNVLPRWHNDNCCH